MAASPASDIFGGVMSLAGDAAIFLGGLGAAARLQGASAQTSRQLLLWSSRIQGGLAGSHAALGIFNIGTDPAAALGHFGAATLWFLGMRSTQIATLMGACFPPDTLVATETGLRPIGQIEARERVWAYNFETGKWELCRVVHRSDNHYDGTLETLDVGVGEVTATAWHPYWVIAGEDLENRPPLRHVDLNEDRGESLEGRWVNSHDLREGDVLFLRGKGAATVRRICRRHESTRVCNLTVERLHTFAVGEMQVLVHNQPGCPLGAPAGNAGQLLLTARPNLTQQALDHIVLRHWATSGATNAGKVSAGTTAHSLRDMITEAAARGRWTADRFGRSRIEFDFGRQIGVNMNGHAATRLRLVVEPNMIVVTAFPF